MKFPDHLELIVTTIKALKEMGGTATPAEITNKVIEFEKKKLLDVGVTFPNDKTIIQLKES